MFAKLLPREEQYFSLFAQMTSYINDAATTLVEMLSQPDGDYQAYVQRLKANPPKYVIGGLLREANPERIMSPALQDLIHSRYTLRVKAVNSARPPSGAESASGQIRSSNAICAWGPRSAVPSKSTRRRSSPSALTQLPSIRQQAATCSSLSASSACARSSIAMTRSSAIRLNTLRCSRRASTNPHHRRQAR